MQHRCDKIEIQRHVEQDGENLEASARKTRYDWLLRIATELNIGCVATGHTADDQAETVLHHLLRGTGLHGLRGIAARRLLGQGIGLVRPLLGITRQEVLGYLGAIGQSYRVDSSNADRNYMRNRIRAELLPLLAKDFNPGIRQVLCHLAEQAANTCEAQQRLVQETLSAAELPQAGKLLIFDCHKLALHPRHLVREVFHFVWSRENWPMQAMGFDQWDRLAALVFGEAVAVDLPDGVHASRQRHVVQVGRRK
jgi:tRNA(Ile)-lysidine synthase